MHMHDRSTLLLCLFLLCSHTRRKESHLPYPLQHPFSSHISRFAVFPDTRSESRAVDLANIHTHEEATVKQAFNGVDDGTAVPQTRESSAQTELVSVSHHSQYRSGHVRPHTAPCQTVVAEKALRGMRIEEVLVRPHPHSAELHPQAAMLSKPGVYWHLPKAAKHQVCTYVD